MQVKKRFQNTFDGIIKATNRYPLTFVLLLAAAVTSGIIIQRDVDHYVQYLVTFLIGALLSVVAQQIYERFFTKESGRLLLMVGALVLAGAYFFAIYPDDTFNLETGIKTGVTVFALLMAFIWIPSIKSKMTFNESFMATFKAIFITFLFTGIIAGGISLIIFAVDNLLFSVANNTIPHTLNIVFTLFAPIFFLSFTPPYFGKKDTDLTTEQLTLREEKIQRAVSCPNYLSILISYIIIPLTALYTVILLAYILLNIGGDFWTKNLLEPLLVSYAITVIVVYILASHLDNKFAHFFRKVFPKVLIPIVLFQTIASIVKISEMGITYGRYYVILFGVFAIIAGIVFSFMPVRKNGLIVAVLLIFSVISIMPPVDAFTVSRTNQISLLKGTLLENNMLENDTILPNSTISNEDKKVITQTIGYLENMGYTDEIDWLPSNVYYNNNFQETFGFTQVYDEVDDGLNQSQYAYLNWDSNPVVNIADYQHMVHLNIHSSNDEYDSEQVINIEHDGSTYKILKSDNKNGVSSIRVMNENEEELIQLDTQEIFTKILGQYNGNEMSVEEATITQENDKVKLSVIANSVDRYDDQYNADIYMFINIK
ncbi:DUF4153 domain-containing protein [Sporosarcina sp. G11-34]|uniref:DUF4153 domain-containing protein n=1 Tax=Sporosarcina sp. G11-34 TaxID=2849605 RepID=UPI0022A90FB1|nr:DUF4153 domain-containing protein [Sporosarcina sp. G11-34]MCZ2259889.1 DUF4153 domain-containing protein [Sporosarcina sp. G11-34]